jgi:hypothetical protein
LTVAIDFHDDQGVVKKSIIVANKDESVTINPDFSVARQGDSGKISVDETQETVTVTLQNEAVDELVVKCHKVHDVCSLKLVNRYRFGRVTGLLGTYNNEKDDVKQANVNEYAAKWKLDSCTETPHPQHAPVSNEARSQCASTFSSRWSRLSYCFKRSDPSEYQKICENLSREVGWNTQKSVAATSFAYQQGCK